MTRVAPAALSILTQATIYRPTRSTASDGALGDARHRKLRSFHNPDARGVVRAVDLTHDPKHGVDAHGWIRWRVAKGDPRIEEAISNRQYWSRSHPFWVPYKRENPHTLHVHVTSTLARENDVSEWFAGWLFNPQPQLKPLPQVQVPPPYAPIEEDEVKLIQSDPKQGGDGKVYVFGATHFRHLSPSKLDQYLREGHKIEKSHPWTVAAMALVRDRLPS